MIILRVSPGQANQMYEFAAGYAFAKERNEELVLDISTCLDSAWGYQLDYFNIPDLPKMLYRVKNVEDSAHTSSSNIPPSLLMHGRAYSDVNTDVPKYKSLGQAPELTGDPVILCGYFFPRHYYDKYWDDVRNMFSSSITLPTLDHFLRLSEGYDSVGIHIRRGDFLVTDWAFKPEDNFFRAAVCWYRKKLSTPRFFVFSDDIEYAKCILGLDSTMYYVHPLGDSEGPLAEFLCLSRCHHMVLSNDSTFSNLAWQLNSFPQKKVVRRDGQAQISFRMRLEKKISRLFPRPETNECIMDTDEVARWAKNYTCDGINALAPYGKKVQEVLACEDDRQAIDMIDQLSLNVVEMTHDDNKALAYRKFSAHVRLRELDRAFDLTFPIWFHFDACQEFHEYYATILSEAGFWAEAAIEAARCNTEFIENNAVFLTMPDSMKQLHEVFSVAPKHRFLLVPYVPMRASSRPLGLVQLGLVLRRLGHEVCFLFKTGTGADEDTAETAYINNHKLLTTRTGVCLGCEQVHYENILKAQGLKNVIPACDDRGKRSILVSHDPALCEAAHRLGRPFIYGGLTQSDPEYNAGKTIAESLRSFMERQAAFILPDACEEQNEYSIYSKRWTFRKEHHLSVREIHRAAALLKWITTNE